MRTGTYYLNNSGSRLVRYVNGKKCGVLLYHGSEDYCKIRTPLYEYSFGNFSGYAFRYKGKVIKCLPEVLNGVIVCFVDHTEKY
jgi:hypothetical protein